MNDFWSFFGLIFKLLTDDNGESETNHDYEEGGGGMATFYNSATGDFEVRSADDSRGEQRVD
jgi:hypothetical protein